MLERFKSYPRLFKALLRGLRLYALLCILGLPILLTYSNTPYGMLSRVVRDLASPNRAILWVTDEGGRREASFTVEESTPERLETIRHLVQAVLVLDQPQDRLNVYSWTPGPEVSNSTAARGLGVALGLAFYGLLLWLDPLAWAWRGRRTRKVQACLVASVLGLAWLCWPAVTNLRVNLRIEVQLESLLGPTKGKSWACLRGSRLGVAIVVDGPVTTELISRLREQLALGPADALCVESAQLAPDIRQPGPPAKREPIPPSVLLFAAISLGWGLYRRRAGAEVAAC